LAEEEDMSVTITRSIFEEKCKELFESCFESIKEALTDAGLSKDDINDIILVGGSSRIPKVQQMIKDYFNGKELCKDINADEAVAYGAAYQAASVEEVEDDALEKLVLIDVTPLSLGLEIKGGLMSKIIKKNTPIPIKQEKIYQTASDNQKEAKFVIYQGERKLVQDNVKIGEYTIKIQGKGKAGEVKFKVIFDIDVNSVLHVSAKEISKDNEIKLDIKAETMKMSDEEIEKKIEEAKRYKEQEKKN
jgi:L1 cell adhesion molecule like protein